MGFQVESQVVIRQIRSNHAYSRIFTRDYLYAHCAFNYIHVSMNAGDVGRRDRRAGRHS